MTKRIYFENLDGLRFFCFLSVFFYHSFHTDFDYIKSAELYYHIKHGIFANGNLGVNFFFVLSGFLITYLLIEEKKINGQIDIKKFWIRRVLRIWPLFYVCVAIGFFVFPVLKTAFGQQPNETASIGYYLTFTNNFDFISKGLPDASILGVLWSVAVEEQFYFIWPLILYLLPIKKYWVAFSAVIICSVVFRAISNTYAAHEYHTLSCIGDMAVGAFGAWLVSTNANFKKRIENLHLIYIALLYVSFSFIFLYRAEFLRGTGIFVGTIERPLIAIVMLMIILEQSFTKKSFFKMSKFKTFTKLGTVSYGLYCLHFIGILTATTLTKMFSFNTELWQVLLIDTSLALTLTIFISLISYSFYEKPFLRMKSRFAYLTQQEVASDALVGEKTPTAP